MNIIYERALNIAEEQKTVIIRLDIQFNIKTQTFTGYLVLANGKEYRINLTGSQISINV